MLKQRLEVSEVSKLFSDAIGARVWRTLGGDSTTTVAWSHLIRALQAHLCERVPSASVGAGRGLGKQVRPVLATMHCNVQLY